MRYYIIAGERSGDKHAADLVKELKEQDPDAGIRGWGGDYMQEAGAVLDRHYRDYNMMGFLEVFMRLRFILKMLKECKRQAVEYNPDALILVDFAAFNLRVARYAHQHGLKVYYYISPKLWAWNSGRAKQIKKYVDRMFCILPFETDFYRQYHQHAVHYVGNPVQQQVKEFVPSQDFKERNGLDSRPVLAILPGSRLQEVQDTRETLIQATPHFSDHQIVVAAVSNLPESCYQPFVDEGIKVIYDQTYDLLAHASLAAVISGTATLETALFEVPQVVGYRTSWVSYRLGKWVINVSYISLINLILNRQVVKELIQQDFTPEKLSTELAKILEDSDYLQEIKDGYKELKNVLGDYNSAKETARLIVHYAGSQE